MSRGSAVRAALLVVLVVAMALAAERWGHAEVHRLRAQVDSAGAWGPAVFVGVYVVLAMVPFPKAVITAVGGALFGLWAGAALALGSALVGATASFTLGRLLGRDAVDRLTRGRLDRVDALLSRHGIASVVSVRLVPVVPFTAINYGAGLTGVRRRDFVLGSAVGMVPGSLAYTALGAYGTQPWGIIGAGAALAVLVVGSAWWTHRLRRRQAPAARPGPSASAAPGAARPR